MEEKVFFKSTNGLTLCGIWTIPKRPNNRAVILAHGITVEKNEGGVFTNLANDLADQGFSVFRFDFRGHGESEGRSVDVTLTGEIQDLESACNEVRDKGYTDIGLVGASFGGGIAVLYAFKHPNIITKLFLWNPVLNYDHCYLRPTMPSIVKRKNHIKKELREKGWATLYGKNFVAGKLLFDEMARMFPYKEIKKLKLPILIIHGDKDTKVPYEDSREASVGVPNITFVTIKNADHGFHDSKSHAQEANKVTIDFLKDSPKPRT